MAYANWAWHECALPTCSGVSYRSYKFLQYILYIIYIYMYIYIYVHIYILVNIYIYSEQEVDNNDLE